MWGSMGFAPLFHGSVDGVFFCCCFGIGWSLAGVARPAAADLCAALALAVAPLLIIILPLRMLKASKVHNWSPCLSKGMIVSVRF
jgi:hypothetical protein